MRQDRAAASAALKKLITLQGHVAQALTLRQWVRVLRCQEDNDCAMSVVTQGLPPRPSVVGQVQGAAAGGRQAGAQDALKSTFLFMGQGLQLLRD